MLHKARLQTIICTTRLEESRSFYRQKLGLAMKDESEGAVVFDVGGSDLRLSPVPSMTPGEHTVIGFSVADIQSCVTGLSDKGLVFERIAGLTQDALGIFTTPGGSRVAWMRDPDGNLLSIVQFPVV